jgi:hypothetical protein
MEIIEWNESALFSALHEHQQLEAFFLPVAATWTENFERLG